MKNLLLTVVSIGFITAAFAANTYVDWTQSGDTYSGAYTDVNRWNPQTYGYPGSIVPGTEGWTKDLIARFNNIEADYTVSFPAGTTTTYADLNVLVPLDHAVTFDGLDSVWDAPKVADYDVYRFDPIYFYAGPTVPIWSFDKRWSSTGARQEAIFTFSNFRFAVAATNGVRRLDFTAGDINFKIRRSNIFGTSASSACDEDMEINFAGVSKVTIPEETCIYTAGAHNRLTFSGCPVVFSRWVGLYGTRPLTIAFKNGATETQNFTLDILASDTTIDVLDNSKVQTKGFYVSQSAAGQLRINVARADAMTVQASESFGSFDGNMKLGNATGATGTIAVTDGAVFGTRNGVRIATFGYVDGDTVSADSFGGAYFTNSIGWIVGSTWTVNRGEVVFGPGSVIHTGASTVFAGSTASGASSRFVADGAWFGNYYTDASSQAAGIIRDFTQAQLGAGGLTFGQSHSYAITYYLPQNFEDLPGAEGKLIFENTASGVLTGTASTESHLVVGCNSGYRVTMKDGARHYSNVTVKNGGALCLQGATQTGATFKSLTLGEAATVGVLELDADEPVTVDGPINFVNGQIKFGTTLANGTHTVFKSTKAAQTGSAVTDWMFKKGFTVTAGVTGYYSCKTVEQGGELLFQIVVSDAQPTIVGDVTYDGTGSVWTPTNRAVFAGATPKEIALAGGVDSASMRFTAGGYAISGGKISMSDVTGAAIDAQTGTTAISSDIDFFAATEVNVADGAKLTLGGDILGVGLTKTGAGELEFESPEITLANGLTLTDGSTSFGEEATYDAALNIATTDSTKPVIVRADEDVTLPIGSVTQGSLIKWGSGKLTLTAKANVTLTLNALNAANVGSTEYDLSDYDDTASKPHGPINVAEGELVIRGTSATRPSVTITCPSDNNGRTYVGIPTANGSVANPKEPGLVIDHANVAFSSRELMMGYGLVKGKTFSRAPYLVVTNGSYLSMRNFNFNGDSMSGTAKTVVYFNNSSMVCNQNYAGAPATNCFTFVNGSSMFNGNNSPLSGSVDFSFDRSGWYGGNSNTVQSVSLSSIPNGSVLRYAFRNGSCFAGMFGTTWSGTTTIPIDITFADSEWFGGDADRTLPTTLCNVRTHLEGTGIRVRPPTGRTWTFNQPMTGEGGFTLAGAGTFVFDVNKFGGTARADPLTACYTGLTDVQAGTLRFTANSLSNFVGRTFKVAGTLDLGGASVTGAVVTTAGGTVRNATLVKPTFLVECDASGVPKGITLDGTNGLALDGRVTFDFGGKAFAKGTALTVATWTGTKPDVSKWRSANVGEGLRCTFEAQDNGEVVATVVYRSGLMLLVK